MSDDSDFDFGAELDTMDDIATGNDLLPEGEYNFVVKGSTTGVSSNNNPSIGLQLEIIDGPYRGKRLLHTAYYNPNKPTAIEFFWRQMKTLGITSKWVRENRATQKVMADKAVGVTLVAAVKHEEYQDELRARTNLKRIIGTNPNLDGSAPTAVTGVAQPPAQNTLPDLVDEEPEYVAPAKEVQQEPVTPDGAAIDADDPWGTKE